MGQNCALGVAQILLQAVMEQPSMEQGLRNVEFAGASSVLHRPLAQGI